MEEVVWMLLPSVELLQLPLPAIRQDNFLPGASFLKALRSVISDKSFLSFMI